MAQVVYYISLFRLPVASFHPVTRHLCGTLMEPSFNISSWYKGPADGGASQWPPRLSSPGVCNSAWALMRITRAEGDKGHNSPPNRFLEHVEDTLVHSEKTKQQEHSLLQRPGPADIHFWFYIFRIIYRYAWVEILLICSPLLLQRGIVGFFYKLTTSGLFDINLPKPFTDGVSDLKKNN